jgi:hypothetical protein
MKKLSLLAIVVGASVLTVAPVSVQWTPKKVGLYVDKAEARHYRRAYRHAYYGGYYGYAYPPFYPAYSYYPSWIWASPYRSWGQRWWW